MFKVNYKSTRTGSMTSFWCYLFNFEHVSHLFLVFFIADFEQMLTGKLLIQHNYQQIKKHSDSVIEWFSYKANPI